MVASLAVGLLVFWLKHRDVAQATRFGGVVFLSMFFTLFVASIAGSLVPITLKRLNFDPAIASSVFVITITDVLGFLVFLLLASKLLALDEGGRKTSAMGDMGDLHDAFAEVTEVDERLEWRQRVDVEGFQLLEERFIGVVKEVEL